MVISETYPEIVRRIRDSGVKLRVLRYRDNGSVEYSFRAHYDGIDIRVPLHLSSTMIEYARAGVAACWFRGSINKLQSEINRLMNVPAPV